ncbi:MAG: hypothetical protein EPO63_05210 [Candidatus Nitrosotenuis sp.]|nr:MAG: hypothetical protein EPO63_05210 [Candidatus Nitrosotenuis sp.]
MGTTISLNDDAYRILKAQKREGESFSDLILREFRKGNPITILDYLKKTNPNHDLAETVEKASEALRKSLKLERVDL